MAKRIPKCRTCRKPIDPETGEWIGRRGNYGEPCPECGRRKITGGGQPQFKFKKGDPYTVEMARKGGAAKKKQVSTFTEELNAAVRETAENVVRPYVEGLALRPRHDATPGSKLRFYMNQMQLSEAVINRLDGTPVQRTRAVTKNDDDVLPATLTDVPQIAIDKLLVAISAGNADEILGQCREPTPIGAIGLGE